MNTIDILTYSNLLIRTTMHSVLEFEFTINSDWQAVFVSINRRSFFSEGWKTIIANFIIRIDIILVVSYKWTNRDITCWLNSYQINSELRLYYRLNKKFPTQTCSNNLCHRKDFSILYYVIKQQMYESTNIKVFSKTNINRRIFYIKPWQYAYVTLSKSSD